MSGTNLRNAIGIASSWLFLAVIGYVCVVYPTEIKHTGYWLLGIDPKAPFVVTQRPVPRGSRADLPTRRLASGTVELEAGQNGHFRTTASMNGRDVDVLVDTGASVVALTYEDAERAGIYVRSSDFTHRVSTANGSAKVAPVRIDQISIGDITIRDVQGLVSEPGRLRTTLLGNSFLSRLKRWEMRDGKLALEQ